METSFTGERYEEEPSEELLSNPDGVITESPLVASLREHFVRYYGANAPKTPFSSKNEIVPPLYLDLINARSIQEMCKTR